MSEYLGLTWYMYLNCSQLCMSGQAFYTFGTGTCTITATSPNKLYLLFTCSLHLYLLHVPFPELIQQTTN